METPQNQSQPTQQTSQPSVSGNLGGLYAAITAEDEVPIVEERPQKHVSWFMKMVIGFMRITFWMDLTKRSNEPVFRLLGGFWALVMAVLYLSGIITLILCLTSFIHLPLKLENFFNENNIKYDTLEMADYSLTQINITNLHDENNIYQIPQVKIQSTFGDFLKNKILAITASGVRISVSNAKEKTAIQWMMDLFSTFNGSDGQKLDVDSLTIDNALLTLSGKKIAIPIAFSLTGDYTQSGQTSITFSINEDFLKAQGSLTLSGENNNQQLNLSITSGILNLPDRPQENLTGEVKATLSNGDLQTGTFKFNLEYGLSVKEISGQIQKSNLGGFDGTLSFVYKNKNEENTPDEETANSSSPLIEFSVRFSSLQIDEKGHVSSTSPLEISIQHFEQNNLILNDLGMVLEGDLTCQAGEGKCQYQLKKATEGQLQSLTLKHKSREIILNQDNSFRLMPQGKPAFVLQLKDPSLQYDLLVDNLQVGGYVDKANRTFSANAERLQLANIMKEDQKEAPLTVKIQNGQIETPEMTMKGIQFSSDDVLTNTNPVKFQAETVQTNSTLIKKPFSAQLISLGNQTSIKCQILDSDITFIAKGAFDLFKGAFSGNFMMSPILIDELPFELKELSDFVPKNFNNLKGQIAFAGKMNWNGIDNVSGTMYLGLKDISFDVNETHIQNLNTVLTLQSLIPFISVPNQSFFVSNIEDFLNLSNISGNYQIKGKQFNFFGLTGELANQPLYSTTASFSLDDLNTTVHFKTSKDFKVNDLTPYLDLPDLKLKNGTGSFSMPLSVSENGLEFSDLTFKVNDSVLSQESTTQDIFNLFDAQTTSYYIRSGKFVLNKGINLEASLEGWLLPGNEKRSVEEKEINLPAPLIKKSSLRSIPKEILSLLNSLFNLGKAS